MHKSAWTLSSAGSERRSRLRRDGGRRNGMYFVYILHSASRRKYYIGSTQDLIKRQEQHNSARTGYTSSGQPWVLVHSEIHGTKREALKRERHLKRMKSARFIEALFNRQREKMDA